MPRSADPRLVADVARELGRGGLPSSERQLWYAVCARMERPQVTQGLTQLAAGVALIAVGVIVGILASVFVALLVPFGMVVAGTGIQNRRLERARPTARPLALSYDEFRRDGLVPGRQQDAAAFERILRGEEEPAPRPADGVALVVTDSEETAHLLESLAPAGAPTWQAVSERALGTPPGDRRLYCVHDADPRGCALPLRLAAAGATEVVDLGLRPGQITGRRLPVIEGAPYLLVEPKLGGLLQPSEVVWLADGRRVELAALPSAELVPALRSLLSAPPTPPPGGAGAVALGGGSLVTPDAAVARAAAVAHAAEADDEGDGPA